MMDDREIDDLEVGRCSCGVVFYSLDYALPGARGGRMTCTDRLTQIAEGVYSCPQNHMHLDLARVCRAGGYPATPENLAMLQRTMEEMFPGKTIVSDEEIE